MVEPLLEGATLVSPVFVIVAGSHDRANTGQMRRMRNRRQHLGRAHIRSAPHADFAVRIRQRRRPFHGVVTIVRFVLERVPLSVRGVAAADVLNDDDVSRRRSLEGRKPLRRSCCKECAAAEPETARLPSAGKCPREELRRRAWWRSHPAPWLLRRIEQREATTWSASSRERPRRARSFCRSMGEILVITTR